MDRVRGHGTAKIFGCTKSLDIDVHSREHVLVGIWYCCIRKLVVLVLIISTADFMLDPSPKSATLCSLLSVLLTPTMSSLLHSGPCLVFSLGVPVSSGTLI